MKLIDSAAAAAQAAAQAAAEAARRAAEAAAEAAAKAAAAAAQKAAEVAASARAEGSSFEKALKDPTSLGVTAAIDTDALKKANAGTFGLGLDEEAIGKKLASEAVGDPEGVSKALGELPSSDRDDVAEELTGNLSDDQLKDLAKSPAGKQLLEKLRFELDDGATWPGEETQMGRIDKAMAAAKAEAASAPKPSNLPDALQPQNAIVEGDQGGLAKNDKGENVRAYKTGENVTKVPDGHLEATPEDIDKRKAAQAQQLDEMQKTLGRAVGNPPSISDARDYFQKLSNNGSPQDLKNVQTKYGEFLKNFYVHAGQGVTWGAGKNLANDLQRSMDMQPVLKDGRRVVDCEGFAALNENILGKLKDKAGKPVFEIMHIQNGEHVLSGVFRRGQPFTEPFLVNNDKVRPFTPEEISRTRGLGQGKDFDLQRLLTMSVFEQEMGSRPSQKGRTLDAMQ